MTYVHDCEEALIELYEGEEVCMQRIISDTRGHTIGVSGRSLFVTLVMPALDHKAGLRKGGLPVHVLDYQACSDI